MQCMFHQIPSLLSFAGSLRLREYQGHGRQHIHTCTFGGKNHREEPVLQEGRLADCCILGFSAWTFWVFNFGVSVLMAISWVFTKGQIHRSWDPKIGETLRIWALHRMLVPCQPVHLLVWPASRFIWPLRDLMMPWQPVPMLFEREKKVENWRTEELSVISSKLFKFEHVQRREVMQKFQIQRNKSLELIVRSQDEI